jgi:hypothetical protein
MQKNELKKIIIIGGGWYGCHIASILMDKYNITLIEKNNDIFNNSSYFNQNRLHVGFHYCRNYATRQLCMTKYNDFLEKYNDLIDYIDNNYYVISNQSLIDYQTYINIYTHEGFIFDTINNTKFQNIDGKIIRVNENVINSDRVYNYFKNKLQYVKQILNTRVVNYTKINNEILVETTNGIYKCDILLDCTYNQLGLSKNKYIYENTLSLLFKKTSELAVNALTIMDGPFLSLYPRDIHKKIYTLTDVEYTPLIKSNNYNDIEKYKLTDDILLDTTNKMIQKILLFYPDFEDHFSYEGYFISKKTKQISGSDSRDIIIEEIETNVISVNCGKIYGIFDWEDYILNYLEKYNSFK